MDPWTTVEQSADRIGTWQARGTRENSFFSSYIADSTGWSYRLGDFALRSLPPDQDYVNMTVIARNASSSANSGDVDAAYTGEPVTISVPFVSQNVGVSFTSGSNLWNTYCRANSLTNGVNYFGYSRTGNTEDVPDFIPDPFNPSDSLDFSNSSDSSGVPALVDPSPPRFADPIPVQDRNRSISAFIDLTAFANVVLPPFLSPTPLVSNGTAQFYLQGEVGILALGSFSTGADYGSWFQILKDGLNKLKTAGATRLIVDVVSRIGDLLKCRRPLHPQFLLRPHQL